MNEKTGELEKERVRIPPTALSEHLRSIHAIRLFIPIMNFSSNVPMYYCTL